MAISAWRPPRVGDKRMACKASKLGHGGCGARVEGLDLSSWGCFSVSALNSAGVTCVTAEIW